MRTGIIQKRRDGRLTPLPKSLNDTGRAPFGTRPADENRSLEAYLGFFFDFFGVSLVVVAGSVVGLA